MKQYTHAWLAFMAVKRLQEAQMSKTNKNCALSLVHWFKNHKDSVVQGAWYPDKIIKDMANSHVLKFNPAVGGEKPSFRKLPTNYLLHGKCKTSPLKQRPYERDPEDNLPSRCEALAHAIIDNLKMQFSEDKGSPIAPNDNHIAALFFMLSHYVADAHVPFHCDRRRFSEGSNVHAKLEAVWDEEIKTFYLLDKDNERFFYDPSGYPLFDSGRAASYDGSFLKKAAEQLAQRRFSTTWGAGNLNVWDFMSAVCQHSYLMSYLFIPEGYDHHTVTTDNWTSLGVLDVDELSVIVMSDAVDSIARVYFKVWRKYRRWARANRNSRKGLADSAN